MQLSTRSDYAIKIMLYLAAQLEDRWVPTPELAAAISTSGFSVQKIVLDLSTANLLRTMRGRYGGVKLVRDLAEIRVSEVIGVGERGIGWKFTECDRQPDCDCYLSGGNCTLRSMFKTMQEQIMEIFSSVTMAQMRTLETDRAAREHSAQFRANEADNTNGNVIS